MSDCKMMRSVVYMLFFLTCIMATFDTQLFVYPSLSRFMFLEIGMLALFVLAMFVCMVVRKGLILTIPRFFLLIWIGYIWIHYNLSSPHELYRTMYLSISLLTILSMSVFFDYGVVCKKHIENILLSVGIIHVLFVVAQYVGVVQSGSIFFRVTGADENPTVSSLYLTGLVPLLVFRIAKGEYRNVNVLLLIAFVLSVFLLRCRTAYIGLACEALVLFMPIYNHVSRKLSVARKVGVVGLAFLCMCFCGSKMYEMKKDSADGRILIWRLSSEMIIDRPGGYGYGLFEKYYNLKQAEYFKSQSFSQKERRNADYVYMPYNDYLEHGTEGGVVGMLFFLLFYIMGIYYTVRSRLKIECAFFVSFAVMSMSNFVYTSIMPWMLVVTVSSVVYTEKGAEVRYLCLADKFRGVICMMFMLMAVCIAYKTIRITRAQIMLADTVSLIDGGTSMPDITFSSIEPYVGTSEAFWNIYARNCILSKNYERAITCLDRALEYTSSPSTLFDKAMCLKECGCWDGYIMTLSLMSYMLPHDLELKYRLMYEENAKGNVVQAMRYACDIVQTSSKKNTPIDEKIIKEAIIYKENHEGIK